MTQESDVGVKPSSSEKLRNNQLSFVSEGDPAGKVSLHLPQTKKSKSLSPAVVHPVNLAISISGSSGVSMTNFCELVAGSAPDSRLIL